MSGAGARPEAIYTWNQIKDGMQKSEDAKLDQNPKMGAKDLSWLRFLLILTAHGWFIRPKAFPLKRDGDKDRVSPAAVMRRVYGFLALWAAMLIFLPLSWVGVAALAWTVAFTPGLIEIHRQFQNEPDVY